MTRTTYLVSIKQGKGPVEKFEIIVEDHEGKRSIFRKLKERVLRDRRRKGFKILKVEKLD